MVVEAQLHHRVVEARLPAPTVAVEVLQRLKAVVIIVIPLELSTGIAEVHTTMVLEKGPVWPLIPFLEQVTLLGFHQVNIVILLRSKSCP